MIDRIPGRIVPPLLGILRASAGKWQPASSISRFRPDRKLLHSSSIRPYASPHPTAEPEATNSAGPQVLARGNGDSQSRQLPRDFPPPEQSYPPPPPPPPPRPKRSLRPFIYASVFFLIGGLAGQFITLILAPPAPPVPGSREDEVLTAAIHERALRLPIVQSLTDDPAWRSWDAYSTFTPEEKLHRITSGPLAGSRGLGGYQRIFYNRGTGECVAVLWLGSALAGWPGVVHGGVIATVMDECMGRCAIAKFPAQTGVTANLDFKYIRPVQTNAFYVVRATPSSASTERKGFVTAQLETVDGHLLVQATGLFVVPKKLPESALKRIEMNNLDEGF